MGVLTCWVTVIICLSPKDADELADKMRSIVDKGERLREVTRNSNNVVNFDLDHAIQSLKKLYKSVEDR